MSLIEVEGRTENVIGRTKNVIIRITKKVGSQSFAKKPHITFESPP